MPGVRRNNSLTGPGGSRRQVKDAGSLGRERPILVRRCVADRNTDKALPKPHGAVLIKVFQGTRTLLLYR